jgi:hypothetical protein
MNEMLPVEEAVDPIVEQQKLEIANALTELKDSGFFEAMREQYLDLFWDQSKFNPAIMRPPENSFIEKDGVETMEDVLRLLLEDTEISPELRGNVEAVLDDTTLKSRIYTAHSRISLTEEVTYDNALSVISDDYVLWSNFPTQGYVDLLHSFVVTNE